MANRRDLDKLGNIQNPAGIALPDFVKEINASSLSKSLIENDRGPTKNEISQLRKRIADAFQTNLINLAEFPNEQETITGYLETARRTLISNTEKDITLGQVLKAEENLNRALVLIDRNLKSINSIRQTINIVIMSSVVYLIIIGVLAYLVYLIEDFSLLGVPGLTLAWGCLGGVTVILFRHRSMMEKRWPFNLRWLWILVRPLLGMIMGGFMYLGVASGLLFFNASIQGNPQKQILWVLAFVAGFSDRIWEILIKSTLGPYGESDRTDKPSEIDI